MGLVVYWYDLICFGIVGVSFLSSLYVIWSNEGSQKSHRKTLYENLLIAHPHDTNSDIGYVEAVASHPRGHVSSSQLWTSCWLGLHPAWLLGFRFVAFTVMTGFLAWDIWEYDSTIFVYYTEWTFAFVILYFAIGTIVSAHGCILYYFSKKPSSDNRERGGEFPKTDAEQSSSTSSSSSISSTCTSTDGATFRWSKQFRGNITLQSYNDQESLQHRAAGFWGYPMQTAYQTCAGAIVLTDIVFWCIIVPFLTNSHLKLDLLMECMHSLNAVFLLLDTSVNSLPFPWFRLSYFVLWSCCYVIFQWVIHACGFSWWPYPFLELSTPWAPLWYTFFAVVHIPCYGLYYLIVQAENSVFSKLFPHAFVRLN